MNKTEEILMFKEFLESGLISQSDFDRLKKQIFEGEKNVSNEINKISQSEFNESIQQRRTNDLGNINSKKKCSQCGSDNAIENSECKVCKTDFSTLGNKNEQYVEIEHESNNSKYLIFGILAVLLIVISVFYFSNSNKSNNNQESNIQLNDSVSPSVSLADTTSQVNQECADCPPSDTLIAFQNDTTTIDENVNNKNQKLDDDRNNDSLKSNSPLNSLNKEIQNDITEEDVIKIHEEFMKSSEKLDLVRDKLLSVLTEKEKNIFWNKQRNWFNLLEKKADKLTEKYKDDELLRNYYTTKMLHSQHIRIKEILKLYQSKR